MPKNKRTITRRSSSSTPVDAEFNPDYTDIKKDLKRIAILASTFIVVLIVISFFLR